MTEPIKLSQIEEWNKERLYGLIIAHRKRRSPWAWLRRRPPELCTHTALGRKLPVDAMRDAEAMSLESPCVVLLIDVEASELAGRWVTDPQVADVRIEETIGGLDA